VKGDSSPRGARDVWGKIEKLKDRRWRSATTEASRCEKGGALIADFHGSGRGNRFQVCQFKKLGLKIPPNPPFSKGRTIPFSFEKGEDTLLPLKSEKEPPFLL
jgi:hypothetical protein